jgi:hypothetical protein
MLKKTAETHRASATSTAMSGPSNEFTAAHIKEETVCEGRAGQKESAAK